MANDLKRDRDKRRKQADATMRRMRQQNHMQAKQLLNRILDVCYDNFIVVSGISVIGGNHPGNDDWEPLLTWDDHPHDDVFRKAVGVISKALWNCYQLGKEDTFVIEVVYDGFYDELTWQDWMKLRYKVTPNPNLNDLDNTHRRETLKHLLPSGSPDTLLFQWPWDYQIRNDPVAKMHKGFLDSNTVLIFKGMYPRFPGHKPAKIIFRLYPNLPAGDQDLKHIVRKWIKRNPYPLIDQNGVPEHLRVDETPNTQ